MAIAIGNKRPSIYLDLESEADRAKLSEPELNLASHSDKLVILDEVQRLPDVFKVLRGLIDRNRRAGRRTGQFLLLGSASIDLLKQSRETMAGRIAYLEMSMDLKYRRILSIRFGCGADRRDEFSLRQISGGIFGLRCLKPMTFHRFEVETQSLEFLRYLASHLPLICRHQGPLASNNSVQYA